MDKRPFESVGQMNEYIMEKWNKKVHAHDEVVILGDFSLGSGEETNQVLRRLKGKLFLIRGNHDERYFDQIRKVVLTYKDAAGMWWADKWRPLAGCIANLTLNIILVKIIGVAGVMISTVISYAFVEMPWETHVLFKLYFKKSEIAYYKEMLITTLKMTIAGIITYGVCELVPFGHIVSIAVKLVLCVFLTNAIFILLNIKNEDFKISMSFLKKIIKEIKNKGRNGLISA